MIGTAGPPNTMADRTGAGPGGHGGGLMQRYKDTPHMLTPFHAGGH